MNWLRRVQLRFRALFQKEKLDARMDDEIRSHIEMETRENIDAGMKPDEARYAALRQFGWVESIKATCRDQRGVGWLEALIQDIRFGARMLRKNPGFTAVAVLTLALGIGTNTAIFSVVKSVLLRPPPYPKPERLALISLAKRDGFPFVQGCSGGQLGEWRSEAKSFEALAGYIWTFNFLLDRDGSESMEMAVGADYFRVTGLRPMLGRSFNTADIGQHPVVLLGYELWRRRFHSDANILGQTIRLSRWQAPLTVVGVMPPGIRFLPAPINSKEPKYDVNAFVDFWIAASPDVNDYSQRMWNAVGRLKPSVSIRQAEAEPATIATHQAQSEPEMRLNLFNRCNK